MEFKRMIVRIEFKWELKGFFACNQANKEGKRDRIVKAPDLKKWMCSSVAIENMHLCGQKQNQRPSPSRQVSVVCGKINNYAFKR